MEVQRQILDGVVLCVRDFISPSLLKKFDSEDYRQGLGNRSVQETERQGGMRGQVQGLFI